jgi:hypothetical protein
MSAADLFVAQGRDHESRSLIQVKDVTAQLNFTGKYRNGLWLRNFQAIFDAE